jgi:4-azaleucine resistance transporter AzlC
MNDRRVEFFSGFQGVLPILVGVIPFGMIYGALALAAGISANQAQAMSVVIFAGSAQFITTQLVGNGAPGLVIVLTVAVINLRHALYSASMAPHLKTLRPMWKWLLAYLLTDEAYAVTILHYSHTQEHYGESCAEGAYRHWFFLGSGLGLWITWQISTAACIFLGTVIPPSWSLDFTLALTFIALVMPVLRDRPSLAAALSAGVTAVVAFPLPYKLGLVIATLVGIVVGMGVEAKR